MFKKKALFCFGNVFVWREAFICLFIFCSLYCLNNPIQRNVFSCAGLPLAQFVCYEVFSKFTVQPCISAAFSVTKTSVYTGIHIDSIFWRAWLPPWTIKVVVTHAMVFAPSGHFPSGGVLDHQNSMDVLMGRNISKFLVRKNPMVKT